MGYSRSVDWTHNSGIRSCHSSTLSAPLSPIHGLVRHQQGSSMQNNPYQSPQANVAAVDNVASRADGPIGIGGWLILVVIGLVVTPMRIAYMLITTHWPIFRDGAWGQVTTPGTPSYHALWGPFIAFEVIGNILSIVLGLTTLFYLLRKSHNTPRMAILWYAFGAALVVTDFFAGNPIPAVAAQPDPAGTKELIRGLFGAAIWIPYFLVSKRVKATFVH